MIKHCLAIALLLLSLGLAAQEGNYRIELQWDNMAGELNGILSGSICGEFAYVQGAYKGSALGGRLVSLGETGVGMGQQTFEIRVQDGFFSFWIRDKFADDDFNADWDLIRNAKPQIHIYRGMQLLRSFVIEQGSGLTCKVFTLDAATSALDREIRFYPKTKIILISVVNALDNSPVPDAEVMLTGGDEHYAPRTTDADGFAWFSPEIGEYHVRVGRDGYIGSSYPVRMAWDENPIEYVIAISPQTRDYRIVLTWGARPLDLDAHLMGPHPDGGRFHIWYRNRILIEGRDFLDRDDTDGYGPETITIYKPASGEYLYAVHDFSNRSDANSAQLSRSGATVQVYGENRLIATYTVPRDLHGNLWTVFKIDKNHTLIPVNTLSYVNDERNLE